MLYPRSNGPEFFVVLQKIQQTMPDREKTEPGTGKKIRANKGLLAQRRERAFLKAANIGDQFVERRALGFDSAASNAQELQIAERGVAQLLGRSPKQDRAAYGPTGVDSVDGQETGRPSPVIKEG